MFVKIGFDLIVYKIGGFFKGLLVMFWDIIDVKLNWNLLICIFLI